MNSYKSLLSCFDPPLNITDIANIGEDKITELINHKWITYSGALLFIKKHYSKDLLFLFIIKYFEEIIDDDIEWTDYNSNQLGIKILESDLTLEQKINFINKYAVIDPSTNDASHYAELICYTYVEFGIINEDTPLGLLVESLTLNKESNSWRCKITLINKMNTYFDYNKDIEIKMISSLDSEMYSRLNSPYGSAHFDINEENRMLLSFLKEQGHYVNNFYEKDGQIRVSFKTS